MLYTDSDAVYLQHGNVEEHSHIMHIFSLKYNVSKSFSFFSFRKDEQKQRFAKTCMPMQTVNKHGTVMGAIIIITLASITN